MGERVVVGMSGGVDSSVAALLLKEQGHEVIGVTFHLWDYKREGHAGRCCAPEDQYDAARVCEKLSIPHYTFDRREVFRESVIDRFVSDYAAGMTPSPCVRCNESVKIGPMFDLARRLGAKAIATGHYARLGTHGKSDEEISLRVAADESKDQSYFLWAAPREALRALWLPLAELTKPQTRALAEGAGLVNAAKPDSTDLCFIEGGSYADFITERLADPPRAGTIELGDGTVVGHHDGVHHFTVGQRKGTGAGGPPRYVLKIVPERAAVIVGDAVEATTSIVHAVEARWLCAPPRELRVKLRYRQPAVACELVRFDATSFTIKLTTPQRGVAPGQAAVLYDESRVVGGGYISVP